MEQLKRDVQAMLEKEQLLECDLKGLIDAFIRMSNIMEAQAEELKEISKLYRESLSIILEMKEST